MGDSNSKIYVIKSIVSKEKIDSQLHAEIENNSSIRSSIRKDGATLVIWVTSNVIIGKNGSVLALLDKQMMSPNTRHWLWKLIPKMI